MSNKNNHGRRAQKQRQPATGAPTPSAKEGELFGSSTAARSSCANYMGAKHLILRLAKLVDNNRLDYQLRDAIYKHTGRIV